MPLHACFQFSKILKRKRNVSPVPSPKDCCIYQGTTLACRLSLSCVMWTLFCNICNDWKKWQVWMRDIYFSLYKKGIFISHCIKEDLTLVLFWFCDLWGHAGYWRYLYADFRGWGELVCLYYVVCVSQEKACEGMTAAFKVEERVSFPHLSMHLYRKGAKILVF